MVALTLRNTKGSPLTNTEVDNNFSNLNAAVQPAGGTAGQVLSKVDGADYNSTWIDNYSTAIQVTAKAGVALTKGQAVYITGASGANIIVGLAQANTEATSSKTFGLINNTLALNGFGNVVCEGPISGIDTSSATEGDAVWLSPTTPGGLVFGLANKPSAPNHMVYLGVVSRAHATQGQIQVKVQNGFELEELHNVQIVSPTGSYTQELAYDSASGLWKNYTKSTSTVAEGTNLYYTDARARAAVSGSAPISYSASTGVISMAAATGSVNGYLTSADWTTFNNKYSVGGALGTPSSGNLANCTFPTLNQNTTGSSASCTGNAATATTATTATTANALNSSNNYTVNTITASTGTISSALSGATSGAINIPSQVVANATQFVTYLHAASQVSGVGYVQHMALGSYRTGGNWGSVFLGVGGNDSYPTVNYFFDAGGNFTAPGNVTAYSDERLKKNWRPVQEGFVEKLAQVKSGIYDRTDIEATQAGASAQDMQKLLPEVVQDGEHLSLAYGNAALVAAIELAKQVVELKKEIAELKAR